jgi:hypothetical protein
MGFDRKSPFAMLVLVLLFATPIHAAEPPRVEPPRVERVEESLSPHEKLTIGEAEYIGIPALRTVFKARIDTGATTTSIFAINVEEFERDGKPWARFVVKNAEQKKDYPLELPVVGVAKIKKRGRAGETRRPEVELDLTMGEATRRLKVNLADRTGFEYPLLIGRDFLRGLALVDVAKKYTQKTPGAPEAEQ